jgi:hypothetical protein
LINRLHGKLLLLVQAAQGGPNKGWVLNPPWNADRLAAPTSHHRRLLQVMLEAVSFTGVLLGLRARPSEAKPKICAGPTNGTRPRKVSSE